MLPARIVSNKLFHLISISPSLLRFSRPCRSVSTRPTFCVVGSGPAGFYTAQGILKNFPGALIDIYEKRPVPFGLVRYGVAPDHEDIKNVTNGFTKNTGTNGISFLGNVDVGTDVSFDQLQSAYHAVILCTGAESEKPLNIPGEDLQNVFSAFSFVGWYNGHTNYANLDVNLDVETVAILGHGNVSIDVARILLSKVDDLRATDITEYSLEALSRSRVKRVCLIGRRGPLQVAFTIKEFRELINLNGCQKIINIPPSLSLSEESIKELPRKEKRLMDLIFKPIVNSPDDSKQVELKFLRSPTQFLSNADQRLNGVRLSINQLVNEKAVSGAEFEDFECQLAFKSIGLRGAPLSSEIPFDFERGLVPNENLRVLNKPGMYCCGWIASGPIGVIAFTHQQSQELAQIIFEDAQSGHLDLTPPKPGTESILNILKQKKIQAVTFEDWLKIDREEVRRGEKSNKPREKITNLQEALRIAR